MVWCGRTRHSCKKTVSDHTCAVFDAGKPLQNWAKSEGDRKSDPLSGTSHHSENHQTLQFSILLRLHTDLSKQMSWSCILVLCLLLFFLLFRQKDASGNPGPAKPLLLPGNDPKSLYKFFPKLLRSPLWGLLRKIFGDLGIHQKLFEETSFKASILPRRSGRSPLQYAAAFSPEMPFKGAVGCGYTQTSFVWNLLFKGS